MSENNEDFFLDFREETTKIRRLVEKIIPLNSRLKPYDATQRLTKDLVNRLRGLLESSKLQSGEHATLVADIEKIKDRLNRRFKIKEHLNEFLTLNIELKSSEVDEVLRGEQSFLIEVLKKRGMQEQDAEKMQQALLNYVEAKVKERQLKLTEDVKKALANLMVLVAKKLDEET